MLRLLIRFVGLLLLAGSFTSFVVDGSRSLAGGGLQLTSIAAALQGTAPGAYRALEALVRARLPGFVWDPLLAVLMLAPLGLALGLLGALCVFVSHKHEAGIGYPRD